MCQFITIRVRLIPGDFDAGTVPAEDAMVLGARGADSRKTRQCRKDLQCDRLLDGSEFGLGLIGEG